MSISTVLDKEELRAVVADALDVPVGDLTDDAHFVDDLGVDSLLSLELMVTLENVYGIRLSEDEFRTIGNFQDAHARLLGKLQEA